MKLAHTFYNVADVRSKQLREAGICYSEDGTVILSAALYEGPRGTWELDIRQVDGPGQAISHHDSEAAARHAIEIAYATGRQHGRWHVEHRPAGVAGSDTGGRSR